METTKPEAMQIIKFNAVVRLNGSYEAAADEQPRLVRVEQITVTRRSHQQLELEVE